MSELLADNSCSISNEMADVPTQIVTDSAASVVKPKEENNGNNDKIDELSSLEREIAEMHHVEPLAPVVAKRVDPDGSIVAEVDDQHHNKIILEMQPANRNTTPAVQGEPHVLIENDRMGSKQDDDLGHDDLLAVLKGEIEPNNTGGQKISPTDGVEGVTIEGEGEFQIMEIFDDDVGTESGDDRRSHTKSPAVRTTSGVRPNSRQHANTVLSSAATTTTSSKMTREEERAMAMEQMAGLQAQSERNRRRKQEAAKQLTCATESRDIANSIGAEWSDEDMSNGGDKASSAGTPKDDTLSAELKASSDEIQSSPKTLKPPATATATASEEKSPSKHSVKITNVLVLKDAKQNKSKTSTNVNSIDDKSVSDSNESQMTNTTGQQLNSGFRRTRIIKRKIIWDPDAPETQISYAQLVRTGTSAGKAKPVERVTSSPSLITNKRDSAAAAKKARPSTPKTVAKPSVASIASPNTKQIDGDAVGHQSRATPIPKRRAQTPVANGGANASGKKKKVSEIDRLMGDEGAINMLNALEHKRNMQDAEAEGEKPQRLLMRGRSATSAEKIVKKDTVSPAGALAGKTEPASPAKKKTTPKQKPSSMWDYVYQKQKVNEDSMIIRRRSNSSYSSSASVHRLSLDAPGTPQQALPVVKSTTNSTATTITARRNTIAAKPTAKGKNAKQNVKVTSTKSATTDSGEENSVISVGKSFEFAKPESKNNQKAVLNRRSDKSNTQLNPLANDMKKGAAKKRTTPSPSSLEDKITEKKSVVGNVNTKEASLPRAEVVVKKIGKTMQITFSTYKAKVNFTFTTQLMNKLVDVLDKLSTDNDCNAVLLITGAPHFCQGIDFTDLTAAPPEKRTAVAMELATAVKNYLKTLATFPKPLIAGVSGTNIGLGVTQLPLFDVVIASDKGTYETPYVKIGQLPEGFCIWNNLSKIRSALRTKLFWLSEKLHATESSLSGLVNKLTSSNKVNEDALNLTKRIASMSPEAYRVMKKATIQNNLDAIVILLDEEFDVIIKQWTSQECCDSFIRFQQTGSF